jgi:hypothetical protein
LLTFEKLTKTNRSLQVPSEEAATERPLDISAGFQHTVRVILRSACRQCVPLNRDILPCALKVMVRNFSSEFFACKGFHAIRLGEVQHFRRPFHLPIFPMAFATRKTMPFIHALSRLSVSSVNCT